MWLQQGMEIQGSYNEKVPRKTHHCIQGNFTWPQTTCKYIGHTSIITRWCNTQLNSTKKYIFVICMNIHTITMGVWNAWRVYLTPHHLCIIYGDMFANIVLSSLTFHGRYAIVHKVIIVKSQLPLLMLFAWSKLPASIYTNVVTCRLLIY